MKHYFIQDGLKFRVLKMMDNGVSYDSGELDSYDEAMKTFDNLVLEEGTSKHMRIIASEQGIEMEISFVDEYFEDQI